MKKSLLLIIGFCMFSLMSSGKSVHESTSTITKDDGSPLLFSGVKSSVAVKERHRVWLDLTNVDGLFKEILVGYIQGATNDYDTGYDGVSINGNSYLDFYSVLGDKNLVIQGRALPFEDTDEVPLGYRTTIADTFTITIGDVDGVLTDQDIFIEDKLNNVVHNLKDSPYSFTTVAGTFDSRFVLRYVDSSLLANVPAVTVLVDSTVIDSTSITPVQVDIVNISPEINAPIITQPEVITTVIIPEPTVVVIDTTVTVAPLPELVIVAPHNVDLSNSDVTSDSRNKHNKKEKSVKVFAKDRKIKVKSADQNIAKVQVFDLAGNSLYQNEKVNDTEYEVPYMNSKSKLVIIITQLKDGSAFINKIVF